LRNLSKKRERQLDFIPERSNITLDEEQTEVDQKTYNYLE